MAEVKRAKQRKRRPSPWWAIVPSVPLDFFARNIGGLYPNQLISGELGIIESFSFVESEGKR